MHIIIIIIKCYKFYKLILISESFIKNVGLFFFVVVIMKYSGIVLFEYCSFIFFILCNNIKPQNATRNKSNNNFLIVRMLSKSFVYLVLVLYLIIITTSNFLYFRNYIKQLKMI